jgi:hypothetical protein
LSRPAHVVGASKCKAFPVDRSATSKFGDFPQTIFMTAATIHCVAAEALDFFRMLMGRAIGPINLRATQKTIVILITSILEITIRGSGNASRQIPSGICFQILRGFTPQDYEP